MPARRQPRLRSRLWGAAAALALALGAPAAADEAAGRIDEDDTALWVFGDSLSDTGNLAGYPLLSLFFDRNLYVEGRQSNGPLWTDYFAAAVNGEGFVETPALQGPLFDWESDGGFGVQSVRRNTNFAHAGGVSGDNGLNLGSLLGGNPAAFLEVVYGFRVTDQARHFRDAQLLGVDTYRARENDLALMLIGGNDYFNGERDVDFVVGNTLDALTDIRAGGVNNFLVVDLPDLGAAPRGVESGRAAELSADTARHNRRLREELDGFRSSGANVTLVHASRLFALVQSDAGSGGRLFGFTVAGPTDTSSGSCLGDGLVLAACPSTYLFYDPVHPTTRGHELLARTALASLRRDRVRGRLPDTVGGNLQRQAGLGGAVVSARLGLAPDTADGLRLIESSDGRGRVEARYALSQGELMGEFTRGSDAGVFREASRGEALSLRGADVRAERPGGTLSLGAMSVRSERGVGFGEVDARDRSTTLLAYAGHATPVRSVAVSFRSGVTEQTTQRYSGLRELPFLSGRGTARLDAARFDYAETLGEVGSVGFHLGASAELGSLQVRDFQESGTAGLLDIESTPPDTAIAAYRVEAGAAHTRDLGSGRTLELDGAVAALRSGRDGGFGSLFDTSALGTDSDARLTGRTGDSGASLRLGARVAGGRWILSADTLALRTSGRDHAQAALSARWRW